MITYGICILPLINNLKWEIPDATQPWYAENAGELGTFVIIETYFNFLTHQGSERRYHPKPSKIVLIVHPENTKAGKDFYKRHGLRVCTGTRYLRSYIKDDESKRYWIRDIILTCEKNVGMIIKTRGKYTQESYSAVERAIQ